MEHSTRIESLLLLNNTINYTAFDNSTINNATDGQITLKNWLHNFMAPESLYKIGYSACTKLAIQLI